MGDFRILVTGSRDWDDVPAVYRALTHAAAEHPQQSVVIVHGACPKGADAIAVQWTRICPVQWGKRVSAEAHPADWDAYGRAAGMRRNAEMVALGADVCLAFIMPCTDPMCRRPGAHGSHGASHCAQLAEANGIETRRFGVVGEFDG